MSKSRTAPQGESQRDKFLSAARELGCDESEERFDAALGKIVKHKPSHGAQRDLPGGDKGKKAKG